MTNLSCVVGIGFVSLPKKTKGIRNSKKINTHMCRGLNSNRNPYNGYVNPYYWVDDHPLAHVLLKSRLISPGFTGFQVAR